MKARILISFVSLVLIISVLTACGSGGSGSGSAVSTPLVKDAVVTVSFDPAAISGNAKKITSSTNYIQLYITQWQIGDLNTISVVNQDATHVLTPGNPSATLTLYSTYTRICTSQYSSTPSSSTAPTESNCSFGFLNSGNNSVTFTMLNGQWTLANAYNGVGSFVLSYPAVTASTAGSINYGVFDGNTSGLNLNRLPAQSINNWGNQYQFQVRDNSNNIISGFTNENAFSTIFFNSGDNGPSFGGVAKAVSPSGKTVYAIGGFGRGVDSDGWIRETKNIIVYPLNSASPVISYPASALKVEDSKGNIVTSTVLSNCQLQVLSGTSIQGCGITQIKNSDGTDNSNTDIQKGTSTNYNYKVTSTASVAGADICYTNSAAAARDASSNVICYDYDYFSSNGSLSCPAGGKYNNSRCEYTLAATCTNNIHSGSQNTSNTNVFDNNSQACTSTGVGYFLKFNSTALTLNAN